MEYWIAACMLALLCAALCKEIAQEKGYSTVGPFFWGLVLGPIGVLGTAGLPDRKLNHKMDLLIETQKATLAAQSLTYEQLKWQSLNEIKQSDDSP